MDKQNNPFAVATERVHQVVRTVQSWAADLGSQLQSHAQAFQRSTHRQERQLDDVCSTPTGQVCFHIARPAANKLPFASVTSTTNFNDIHANGLESSAFRKAELGRCTWTLLHMIAAQYPEKPTRQQKRDVKKFVDSLTRIYPCGDCANHFMQIVRRDPPCVGSRAELQAWTCRVHNTVNRSIGKPQFNCELAASKWAPLDCGPDEPGAVSGCDMSSSFGTRGRR